MISCFIIITISNIVDLMILIKFDLPWLHIESAQSRTTIRCLHWRKEVEGGDWKVL